MQIITRNSQRILIKDNNEEVIIDDGSIIQYTGIYYKTVNDIVDTVEIETTFIGQVETTRYRHDTGITGIYVKPLYIFNTIKGEWYKIIDYTPPDKKYFLYPHLLMLPDTHYHYHPLYFLHTCTNHELFDERLSQNEFRLFNL